MNHDKASEQTKASFSRRNFMRGAGAATVALSALQARGAKAFWWQPVSPDYGPLSPTRDLATGLSLLALPRGFSYRTYGWSGQTMADGRPTPTMHDGMAVVGRRGRHLSLVRNHENSASSSIGALVEGGMYNPAEKGGTTNLSFDLLTGRFTSSYTSLGGTIRNCAGGPTPWSSWISCEETFHAWGSRADGFNHGYVFDVPGFDIASGKPVRAAGRFSHEAVAVDPRTGVVYETEDTGASGFYKYVQPGAGGRGWRAGRRRDEPLRDGGELFAMVVNGASRKDLRGGFEPGMSFQVAWQRVEDPEGKVGAVFDSAPDAAIISRGEGVWYDAGKIYFVSTDGGAAGLGQVWLYDPSDETLTLLFESTSASEVDGPDNLAVSPRGGIILCEDGGSDPKRMVGLTPDGSIFPFAENLIDLSAADVDAVHAAFPGVKENYTRELTGVYTSQEWAGATFYGDYLFANVQTPGVTFAITGPWRRGAL